MRLMVERMMGVEPTLPAWEAEVLPMNYIRAYAFSDEERAYGSRPESPARETVRAIFYG